MPERPLTIATYAAGASLAAITLVYVFGPTFFLDGESPTSSSSSKKGIVGLVNPANDCFINSILQALAGLPDLRLYLIREVHRRKLDGPDLYDVNAQELEQAEKRQDTKLWKLEGLRQGVVTHALKEVLDKLNERPLYRKTISAQDFVIALERAYRTRLSRQQQDAQEFLQIVTERLGDEYHAGQRARRQARTLKVPGAEEEEEEKHEAVAATEAPVDDVEDDGPNSENDEEELDEAEDGFPFEGKIESEIECMTCHFKPKPAVSTFVTLTLNVPHESSTTLNACFDGMLKVEYIDDYLCDKCRLKHAVKVKLRDLSKVEKPSLRQTLESEIFRLEQAVEEDPETPPKDISLPNSKYAPKSRIARHMRISRFPKVLAIHLSRSLYSTVSLSQKNTAKVSFPESLPLGGILDRKSYRLLAAVTHKGGHNSGHYESFRRQVLTAPFSTPHNFGAEGAYSVKGSPNPSAVQSPRLEAKRDGAAMPSLNMDSASLLSVHLPSPSSSSLSSRSSFSSLRRRKREQERAPTSAPRDEVPATNDKRPTSSTSKTASVIDAAKLKRGKKAKDNRWWRISDDKVKESKTSEVLSMQREVYLLFYELDRRTEGDD